MNEHMHYWYLYRWYQAVVGRVTEHHSTVYSKWSDYIAKQDKYFSASKIASML